MSFGEFPSRIRVCPYFEVHLMPRELIGKLLENKLALAAVVVAGLAVIALLAFLIISVRRRRSRVNEATQNELGELEREHQFAAAVALLPQAKSPTEVAVQIVDIFGEFLWSRVLAIYAGRAQEQQARNLLSESTLAGSEYADRIPMSVPYATLGQFAWPRVIRLSLLTRPPQAAPPRMESAGATQATVAADSVSTGPLNPQPTRADESVLMLPWTGPFGWTGGLIVRAKPEANDASLAHFREPLIAIGQRLGVALEIERLEATPADAVERSVEFSRAVLASVEDQSPVASVVKEVAALLNAESSGLWRIDRASGMVSMVASHGLRSAEFLPLPLGQGLAGNIVQTGELLALEDAPSDPRCIFPREAKESGIASYLGAPVVVDEVVAGVIEVHSSNRRAWTEVDQKLLRSAAAVVAQLLKNSEARGNRLRVESAYLGLSEALQRLRTQDDLLDAAVEVLGHALGVSRALTVELDDEGRPEPVRHEFYTGTARSARGISLGGSLASEVLAADNGKAIAINDSSTRSLLSRATGIELQVQSELAVAVRVEGAVRAIIYLHQCDVPREWKEEEIAFVERVARQLALSLASVRSFETVSNEAHQARESARQASEAGSRVQGLINALPECVLVLDSEGRLNYFNATARDRFGLSNENVGRMIEADEALSAFDGQLWGQVIAAQNIARFEAELSRGGAAGSAVAQAAATAPTTRTKMSVAVSPFRSAQGGPIVGRIVVLSDIGHVAGASAELAARIADLERRLAGSEAQINQARAALAAAQAAEARVRGEADAARLAENEASAQRERARDELTRAQAASQQLLETNRLKSEFIVGAGHEIEASLQPVLGMTELLGQGQYGPLTPEQQEAIRNLYAWARRIKNDVDWLIEYGSARSRRLEAAGDDGNQ